MRILVIGCGYVGKAAARVWKSQDHTLTLTTRSHQRIPELAPFADRVLVIQPCQFKEVLKEQEVVLLSVAPDSSAEDKATYLGSAEALLCDLDPTTKQILYTSSTSVYGEHGGAVVDESTLLKPSTPREQILAATEKKLQESSCKVCILRLGEIVGPGRMAVDRLRALNGRPLAGTGASITNLSPIEEIVRALTLAVQYQWEGIYNVCSDLHIPRRDYYDDICKEAGIQPVIWDPSLVSPHAGNKTVSNAKYSKAVADIYPAFPLKR